MKIFKPSSLYALLTISTTEPIFVNKIIVSVINKGKIVAFSQKNEVIDVDTSDINLEMINVWCSDFSVRVIDGVITSDDFNVWCRISMTDCCYKAVKKVSTEFSSLADCLVIGETVITELELKAGRIKCLKVSSLSSCIMIKGMLVAELESRTGAVNNCEIPLFNGWIMS